MAPGAPERLRSGCGSEGGEHDLGRSCTCPCSCGARPCYASASRKQPFALTRELAEALDSPLAAYVRANATPDSKMEIYLRLQERVQEALEVAVRQWGLGEVEVVLDGSTFKGTALSDSDVDLVVRTSMDVPRGVKAKLHRVTKAHLRTVYGKENVTFTEKRKSATFKVEVVGPPGGDTPGAAPVPCSEVDVSLRVEVRLPTPLSEAAAAQQLWQHGKPRFDPALPGTRLNADLLFESATVGLPLSAIDESLRSFPSAQTAVRAVKLFHQMAGSISPLKSYCIEAAVRHVVLDCCGGGGPGAQPHCRPPSPLPTESAAQAFYMTLGLFLAEPDARRLDDRLWQRSAVRSGYMFDRGSFANWNIRAHHVMGQLVKLARCLVAAGAGADPDTATELLRTVIEVPSAVQVPGAGAVRRVPLNALAESWVIRVPPAAGALAPPPSSSLSLAPGSAAAQPLWGSVSAATDGRRAASAESLGSTSGDAAEAAGGEHAREPGRTLVVSQSRRVPGLAVAAPAPVAAGHDIVATAGIELGTKCDRSAALPGSKHSSNPVRGDRGVGSGADTDLAAVEVPLDPPPDAGPVCGSVSSSGSGSGSCSGSGSVISRPCVAAVAATERTTRLLCGPDTAGAADAGITAPAAASAISGSASGAAPGELGEAGSGHGRAAIGRQSSAAGSRLGGIRPAPDTIPLGQQLPLARHAAAAQHFERVSALYLPRLQARPVADVVRSAVSMATMAAEVLASSTGKLTVTVTGQFMAAADWRKWRQWRRQRRRRTLRLKHPHQQPQERPSVGPTSTRLLHL